jgi:putative flippase GtrA
MRPTARRYFELIATSSPFAQAVRYGLAGAITAMIYSSIYLALAGTVFPDGRAVMAVPFAFATALIAGFLLHSRWSFAGHGTRENSGRQHCRFLAVHSAGFALNMAFTWFLTARLGAPVWAPLVPTVTITPGLSFLLQRRWVFA